MTWLPRTLVQRNPKPGACKLRRRLWCVMHGKVFLHAIAAV